MSFIDDYGDVSPDEVYHPTCPKDKILTLKQMLHSPLNRVKIVPGAKAYDEGKGFDPNLKSGKLEVIEKDTIVSSFMNMTDENGKTTLVNANDYILTVEEIKEREAKSNEIKDIDAASESVYEIRKVNDLLLKYSNKLDDKIINTDKVAELFMPLIRHSYLVLGFFYTKEGKEVRGFDPGRGLKKYQKEDPVKDINMCITKLKIFEVLYTGRLKIDYVSIERVKELFNPLIKHANLLLGLYSHLNATSAPVPEGIQLTELPEINTIFKKVIKCDDKGEPVVAYYKMIVKEKVTEGMEHHSFIRLGSLIKPKSGKKKVKDVKEVETLSENIYQSDLKNWRFVSPDKVGEQGELVQG